MTSYKRKYTYKETGNWQCDRISSISHDDWSGPGWYRVVGEAGTKLSTHAFTTYNNNGECNTNIGGWVSGGDHPTTPHTTVTQEVIFNRSGWTFTTRNHNISITNCDGFFVYYLPGTTGCMLRYCTQ